MNNNHLTPMVFARAGAKGTYGEWYNARIAELRENPFYALEEAKEDATSYFYRFGADSVEYAEATRCIEAAYATIEASQKSISD